MIPKKLELKNFLSYGEPTQSVDFSDYNMICLSGKNGHGKSALLDALTWAIWGQARKTTGTSKADEGLIRLGQTRMMVSLEFEFNGRTYRVRREYAKTYGKPYAVLDFEIFEQEKERFVSLTDKTIRQTQKKIEQLIGLDFETFSNSAFIKQGQSNEFSKKSPKERKNILANILGLSRYDALYQKALDSSKKCNEEKRFIGVMQEKQQQEINKQEVVLEQCNVKKIALESVLNQLELKNNNVFVLEKEVINLIESKNRFEQITKNINDQRILFNLKHDQMQSLRRLWKETHCRQIKLKSADEFEKEKKILREQEKQLICVQQKNIQLQQEQVLLQQAYQTRHISLKFETDKQLYDIKLDLEKKSIDIKHIIQAIDEKRKKQNLIEQKINEFSLELSTIEESLKEQPLFEVRLEADRLQFEKRRSFYALLVQKGNWTKSEIAELEHRKKVVHDQTNPSCPLCEQVLTIKRKQFLSGRLGDQEKFLKHRFSRLSMIIKKLKDLLVKQHADLSAKKEHQKIFENIITRKDTVEKELARLIKEQAEYFCELKELEEKNKNFNKEFSDAHKTSSEQEQIIAARLERDEELIKINTHLSKLKIEIKETLFNSELFKEIQEKIYNIEQQLETTSELTQQIKTQSDRRSKIAGLCFELKQIKQHINNLLQDESVIQKNIDCEADIKKRLDFEKKELIQLQQQKDELLKEIANLEHEIRRLDSIKQEVIANKKKIEALDEEIEEYTILAQAFGKNGIQALLIEDAIPEIEKEANDILGRLTQNQAQIFIESLRDLKRGGVKETLDIQISDTVGIRPYEMFSGGEAFRIDFSLRIAISKLLARRAGTALQTLVIDEGFGSQDEDGLLSIMNAIYTIQEDFSKIIIVSHLHEFKENFPVHFIIEKGPHGSLVRVEERG